MPNSIAVSITADVADLVTKRAILSAEMKAASKDLRDFAEQARSGMTDELKAGMLAAATAAEKARASIGLVNTELKEMSATAKPATEHVEHGFAGVAVSVREAGLQIRETVGMIGEMREAMVAFGEVLIAAFALEQIHEMAEKMGDAAEKVVNLGQMLGVSTKQVQALQAAAATIDLPFETLQKGMTLLDKKFETTPDLFKKLGIDVRAGADQMTILNAVMDKFKDTADGPNKTALAMTLMGKSGAAMIPFLNQGAEGLAELTKKAEEYGAVNEVATKRGMQLAESMDEGKIAFMGLSQTMTEAFAPLLTAMADGFNSLVKSITASYESGGLMKIVFDGIVSLFEGFGEIINAVGAAFNEMFAGVGGGALDWGNIIKGVIEAVVIAFKAVAYAVVFVADACKASFDLIVGAGIWLWGKLVEAFEAIGLELKIAGELVQTFAKVAYDAFTMNWTGIVSDWDAGLAGIEKTVRARGAQIVADAKATSEQAKGWFAAAGGVADQFKSFSGSFWQTEHKPESTGVKSPGAVRDDGPDLEHHAKAKKGKSDKPSIMEGWKAELADMLADEANFGADDAQLTLQFWNSKLALVKKGTKEEVEARREAARAKLAVLKEEGQDEAASIRNVLAIKTDAAQADVALAKIGLQEKISAIDAAEQAGRIGATAAAQDRAGLNSQLYKLDADLENRIFTLKLRALQDEAQIRTLTKQQRDAINRQIELLEVQHLDRMRVLNAQNAQKMQQDEQKVVAAQRAGWTGVAKTFGDALGQMITFQKGFAATVNGLWQSLVGGVSQAISRMVSNWIIAIATGTAAEEMAHMRLVVMHAKTAAAGAWKAVVGIPIIGPILAPIAAATAFAGVMAFSAEGGYDVPSGGYGIDGRGGQIGVVHPEEMVLPASLANGFRSMFAAPAANNNTPAAANDGAREIHAHYHDHSERGLTTAQIIANRSALAKALKMAHREGHFAGSAFG